MLKAIFILYTLMSAAVLAEIRCNLSNGRYSCKEYDDKLLDSSPSADSIFLEEAAGTDWGKFNKGVKAGVGTLTTTVKAVKNPNLGTVGKAISSAGALVAFAPPPAGPIIGGAMAVIGGVMGLCDDTPSPQDIMMENQKKILDNQKRMMENQRMILENQKLMLQRMDAITENTVQILKNQKLMQQSIANLDRKMTLQWEFKAGDIEQIGYIYETLVRKQRQVSLIDRNMELDELIRQAKLVKDDIGQYAEQKGNEISHFQQYFRAPKVHEYVNFVLYEGYSVSDKNANDQRDYFNYNRYLEGVQLYQELMTARWQLYTIEMASALWKNNTIKMLQLTQDLEKDLQVYKPMQVAKREHKNAALRKLPAPNDFQSGPQCLHQMNIACQPTDKTQLGVFYNFQHDQVLPICYTAQPKKLAYLVGCLPYESHTCNTLRQDCPDPENCDYQSKCAEAHRKLKTGQIRTPKKTVLKCCW